MNESVIIDLLKESYLYKQAIVNRIAINCKFVVIKNDQHYALIMGPLTEFPYHANLVKYFCNHFDIPSGWIKKPDKYDILDKHYHINGGGWMEIDPVNKKILLYGQSTAYGQFQPDDINTIVENTPEFKDYHIKMS